MSRRAVAIRRGLPATLGVAAPADRRFRRPDARPSRPRRLGLAAWRIGRIALAGLLVGAGAVWAARALLQSRVLAVSHVVVHGNKRLSTGEVEALVDGIRGESIVLVDFDRYRKRVMDSPWVADVTLWRVLPSTVEVRVTERVPMAVARSGQQLYLVDRSGAIVDQFGPQYREFDFPVIDGLIGSPSGARPLVDQARVRVTGQFLDAMQTRPDLGPRISQVDVSNARDVVVLLDGDSTFLHLGDRRFVERLQTYLELAATLRDKLLVIDYVDLRFDERVFVGSRGRATAVAPGIKRD